MGRILRRTRVALTLLATGLLLASAASARPPHGEGARFLERHTDQLGLEPAQREAIAQLMERSEEQGESLREQTKDLRRGLHELLQAEVPDARAVMAQADALGEVETELHKLRLSTMMGIHAQLTPEQREQLKELRGDLRDFAGEELDDACAGDVQKLCPDAEDPLARAHCLRQNRGDLSEDCADALHCARRKHLKRHGGFHRRGGPGDQPED